MKKIILVILIILAAISVGVWQKNRSKVIEVNLPPAQNYDQFKENTTSSTTNSVEAPLVAELEPTSSVAELPKVGPKTDVKEINLDVPFTSQAPTGNWAEPWQNACEEASLLMVAYYYQDKKFPSKETVEVILKDMINWEQNNWGAQFELTMEQEAQLAKALFNYRSEIVDNLDAKKLRQYLAQGTPVIVPADGHKLANPFFTGNGPDYHMLVVKGYVGDKFITNDPGTRHGQDFVYTADNLFSSIAEWDNQTGAATGPKRGLILYQN